MPQRRPSLALVLSLLASATVASPASAQRPLPPGAEAISLLGDTLRALPLAPDVRDRYERQLAEARADLERNPASADATIWVGRRLAYLGRHREAIDVFTRGIERFPEDARFLRHRGHRWITVRELDRAVEDLERATRLVAGKPDAVEPDGQPNAQNRPIGTLHSNIAYHLGLAYYLKGDFARAIPIYERELRAASNDDRRVSTAHWLYMSLRRLGREREAAAVLEPISTRMEIVENDAYHRLLLLYKGALPVDSILPSSSGEMSVTDATTAYGVANWHLYEGRTDEAMRLFQRIHSAGQWGAFGAIAAEAELARSNRR